VARRRIRHELAEAGVDRVLLDDVEVVISELLANAVRHALPLAGGALLVAWRLVESTVIVRVTDGGSQGRVESPAEHRGTGVLAEAGRGLRIIGELASDWGVIDHASGLRTVWATLRPGDGPLTVGGRLPRNDPIPRTARNARASSSNSTRTRTRTREDESAG
jgi:anti-sigma regulatory factor (Ser/Thr protein kinase)